MSPIRTRLLLAVMLFLGTVMVCVRFFDGDPPASPVNPLVCPLCGKMLTQKDAPCFFCDAKKTREKVEAAARGGGPKPEPKSHDKTKAIVAAVAFCILIAVAFWPNIHRFIRSRQEEPDVEHRLFRCPRCKRKLRYRATTIGSQGKCPTCKVVFSFPVGEEDTGDDF